ncbi:MAG: helix-turn-helix domain-containing protein [Oscillospiraceae bacterium]|nr:helix-turn-helix domain-containing protein [Oscillospiraceae bacterium]
MYSLNDLAVMTGLTTRTLRNYIKRGILNGEKIGGDWRFSESEFEAFASNPYVRRSLRARRSGDVLDFLAGRTTRGGRACFILDSAVPDDAGAEIAAFFCDTVRGDGVSFTYERSGGVSRVILLGEERRVAEIITAYYAKKMGETQNDA